MTHKKKILLVDDSNTVIMMEKMLLNARGYDLAIARDGLEAVEMARADPPDLVLMDVVMPQMDGFAACQAMRAAEETREVPIIMVTTRGEYENVEKGYSSGANDYVTKPINGLELYSKIKNLLGE